MFGLTNSEGDHGEDVKEYYFYLDSTPTHSYMKYLYKYPQGAFPYDELVAINAQRGRQDFEFELLDTGVFDSNRYFDVFVEYAKASPDDILVEITVCNRGPDAATLHVLPTLWFRNVWSWDETGAAPLAAPDRWRDRGGGLAPGAGRAVCPGRGRHVALHRERHQPRAGERLAQSEARTSRTASTTTSCTAAPTR